MAKRFTYYGNAFDSDAQAFIDAALITGANQQSVLNTFVLMLKGTGTTNSSNLFSKIYALYPYCPIDESTATATAYSYNLINPATFQIAWTGFVSGNYTVNGVIGGSGKYGRSGFIPSVSGDIDSLALTAYSRTDTANNSTALGCRINSTTGNTFLQPRLVSGNKLSARISSLASNTQSTSTVTSLGLLTGNRTDALTVSMYKNGVNVGERTNIANNSLCTFEAYVHAYNNSGSAASNDTREYAGFSIHQGFTVNEMADFFEAWDYYQTNIISGGRNV